MIPDLSVPNLGRKRRAFPEGFPHRRLHVVMRVEQDGRIFGMRLQFGKDGSASAFRNEKLRVRKTVAFEKSLDRLGGAMDFVLVEMVEADGRDADQGFQEFDVARKQLVDARR